MRVQGLISNRALINYRCDPGVTAPLLPAGLRPRLVRGHSIVGVCLIELKELRPRGLPAALGASAMNAGYRIAVEWGRAPCREGVYLHRRDTSSRMMAWLGGRVFPGVHRRSRFTSCWGGESIRIEIESDDGRADLSLSATPCNELPAGSAFEGVTELSAFFENADRGFSPNPRGTEGIRLRTVDWIAGGLEVRSLHARYFDDERRFPKGSLELDSALLMRNVKHEWTPIDAPIP